MISPIKFDGASFLLADLPINSFIALGQQVGNKGIVHTVFLKMKPIHNTFFLSSKYSIGGYCSYYFLYSSQKVLLGIVFVSHRAKTVVTENHIVIGDCLNELPDNFEPQFVLENCGLLVFKANDGSLLIIPSEVEGQLLVRVEKL